MKSKLSSVFVWGGYALFSLGVVGSVILQFHLIVLRFFSAASVKKFGTDILPGNPGARFTEALENVSFFRVPSEEGMFGISSLLFGLGCIICIAYFLRWGRTRRWLLLSGLLFLMAGGPCVHIARQVGIEHFIESRKENARIMVLGYTPIPETQEAYGAVLAKIDHQVEANLRPLRNGYLAIGLLGGVAALTGRVLRRRRKGNDEK